jgi:hypothetical protein
MPFRTTSRGQPGSSEVDSDFAAADFSAEAKENTVFGKDGDRKIPKASVPKRDAFHKKDDWGRVPGANPAHPISEPWT